MASLDIVSGLPHFRLISKISGVDPLHIDAESMLDHAPHYTGLEIMAQTAALHVRQRLNFKRHAFLLSVQHCTMPQVSVLTGRFRVAAVLRHQSSDAFSYHVKAVGPDGKAFEGDLLIGTRDYDHRFSEKEMSAHYQQIWDQLKDE